MLCLVEGCMSSSKAHRRRVRVSLQKLFVLLSTLLLVFNLLLWLRYPASIEQQHSHVFSPFSSENAQAQTQSSKKRRVYVLHENFPIRTYGSDIRLEAIMVMVADMGFEITFISRGSYMAASNRERISALLQGRAYQYTENSTELSTLLETSPPDMVMSPIWFWALERNQQPALVYYLPLIRRYSPNATVVALHDDAHGPRQALLVDIEPNEYERQHLQKDQTFMDSALDTIYKEADVNCFITDKDMEDTISSLKPGQHLKRPMLMRPALPTVASDNGNTTRCINTPFEHRQGYVFVGNGLNPTNYYSISWFLANIWPLIRAQEPSATIQIVGEPPNNGPQCKNRQVHCSWLTDTPYDGMSTDVLQKSHGIYVLGRVEDLESILCSSRVLLSPIYKSTGVNTKSFLSFTYGLPLVSTTKGLSGIPVDHTILVADEPIKFASLAVDVGSNKASWLRAQQHVLRNAQVLKMKNNALQTDIYKLLSIL